MTCKFWPSLQVIVMVRIAQGIVQSCNLHLAAARGHLAFELSPEKDSEIKAVFHRFSVPSLIEKRIFGIVRVLNLEIVRWHFTHKEMLFGSRNSYYSLICWYSHGIINRFGTAKALVRDETISVKGRFVLACKYYLEDHARTLWKKLSEGDKLYLAELYASLDSMQFWMNALQTGAAIDSIQMFRGTTYLEHFYQNYLGLRYYIQELRPKSRQQCFSYGLMDGEIHHFDLYLCFAGMNLQEVKTLLSHLSESNRFRILKLFLCWPLQSIFVEMLNELWSSISQYNFRNILNFIVRERIEKEWQDADYLQIVKEIWMRCPLSYKCNLERDPIYADVKFIVRYGMI